MAFPHFALIYIDWEGNLRHESSPSIANSRKTILSPRVTDEFLRAVARSRNAISPKSPYELGLPPKPHLMSSGQSPILIQTLPGTAWSNVNRSVLDGHFSVPAAPTPASMPPIMWETPPGSGMSPRLSIQNLEPTQHRGPWGANPGMKSDQKAFISVRESDFLRRYYEKIFQNLQQSNCRVLAKAYVKLVEPRKQVKYPYNGRKIVFGKIQQLEPEETKPPWWPTGVSHREPDHLPKSERIRLLIHILCELRTSYGITAQRLEAADQPIRRQIIPMERLKILDEVYRVRKEEEKFLDGVTGMRKVKPSPSWRGSKADRYADGRNMVSISGPNLPDAAEALVSWVKQVQSPIPIEGNPGPDPKPESLSIRSRSTRANPEQPIFVPGEEVAVNPQSIPSLSTQIHQDLSIHPRYGYTRVSNSPQAKRKWQHFEAEPSATLSPHSVGHYFPNFVGSQTFLAGPYGDSRGFTLPAGILPGQAIPEPSRKAMKQYEYPNYFEG
ncbi:uncharacterized protein N7469_002088 [Penicillium citrinum]|uniref:Subtelomeric hrmA-associated cluster protein AFUB-079030/YDR124W-like helical bundle domain-containing protein n=1 Tax=Penicillium citrinum TaxID=5077 RepID=A0A9W9P9V6_PENCI|nr:uncharacterized protein N7469_002088 [Penicillium citrinum]KAJ5240497.1 hypothetical protein N7469_002088 [Penicillium citrinum]